MTLPAALHNIARHPSQSAFVTDFDGTLAPIVDDPTTAVPLPESVAALRTLTERLALVAVVSGRPIEFLRARIAIEDVALVGQYGLERLVNGRVVRDPRVADHLDAVAAAATQAEELWPGLAIERKGDIAFTIHWRSAPDLAPRAVDLAELADVHGLQVQPGRLACELRPRLPVDKGSVFAELGRDARYRAFAGDDEGDVAAFKTDFGATADSETVRIAVRSPEAPSELLDLADVVVDGPVGLAGLLGELADAVSSSERR